MLDTLSDKTKNILAVGSIIILLSIIGFIWYRHSQKIKNREKTKKNMINWEKQSYVFPIIKKEKIHTGNYKNYLYDFLKGASIDAKNIYDAKGFFNDDEDAIYEAFAKIPSWYEYFNTNSIFKGNYGINIHSFLVSFLNEDEINKVYDILSKIPNTIKYR